MHVNIFFILLKMIKIKFMNPAGKSIILPYLMFKILFVLLLLLLFEYIISINKNKCCIFASKHKIYD